MQPPSTSDNSLVSIRKRANLNKSVEISRRQFEEGKFSSNDEVFNGMEQMLDKMESLGLTKRRAATASHLPNAETIAALEEGDRIANDPTRKRRTDAEALAEL